VTATAEVRDTIDTPGRTGLTALLLSFAIIFAWSAIRPFDYFTWLLEVFPVLIAVAILVPTHRRFPLTTLLYCLIWVHAVILVIGGHYTYAREPIFNWIRDTFHLTRNYYDRVGHFAQGFIPAIVAREILLRKRVVRGRLWLAFIVVSICLSFSAIYELIEWRTAVAEGPRATDFLGTQGDPWDTQEDMATCLVGAVVALLTLSRWHDHQMGGVASDS
jgi:putative membrane protein